MQSSNHDSGFTVRLADQRSGQQDPLSGTSARGFRARRRNRHGRGLRGEVMLPTLPGFRTRGERFDELVMDSAQRLHDIWGKTLDGVRFAVDEIPTNLEELVAAGEAAPMGAYIPAGTGDGPLITVYRRVVEQACDTREELQDLVHDVVIEYTAEMLGVAPETLDPVYRRRY
ncbi:metallopeptidase family protein [Pseudarthrobacter sp. J75]|uniref:metallopeptidase family protein n=1 Tax=unclassified Pseudarthrobacter TaxID=2647000 RepID=UPI002E81B11E|nr:MULTISPECIES: metallopeptidase family protein [unclassified Pseudarthrobacter]MEE2521636.1 metallopeptidase family protein [Pseudarthrobacter sp. J47]MEE2527713.1 metallopeptidase family protein [Pseudarthrobacter sp. J75]